MALAPKYNKLHFDDFTASAAYQQKLISYIAETSSDGDFQTQIDDLQIEVDANTSSISDINVSLFEIETGEYWNNKVVSTNAEWSFGTIIGDGAVPLGGTTGQTLLKTDGTDYNYAWGDLTASTGLVRVLNDFRHDDTSSVADVTATGDEVFSSVTFDGFGHVQTFAKRSLAPSDIGAQPVDATLTTIAATDPTTDEINYFTGTNVASVTTLSAYGRSLIDDADAATARATLELSASDTVTFDTAIIGEPGFEAGGITIHGVLYESHLKVSDIGAGHEAMFILHRHSNTLPPVIVASRSLSADSSHGAVTSGDGLLSIFGVGWDGTDYEIGGSIALEVDGTPGTDDMPGRWVFSVTPDGGFIPVEAMRISQDKTITLAVDLALTEGGTGASTAADARTNLDVDQAGTDNSTDVTLAGTPDYITIVGQVITRALVNLTSHITGILPLANGGTGSSTLTSGEVSQIENINSVTISNAQWAFLGDFDQALTTTSNVSFGTGTFSGVLKTTDVTDSTSVGTGAFQSSGGGSFAKSIHVGNNVFLNTNNSSGIWFKDAGGAFALAFRLSAADAMLYGRTNIEQHSFYTQNILRYSITSAGHMSFAANGTQDFGSASFRCRRAYLNRVIFESVATASRPTGEEGMSIVDSSLGIPIWYIGGGWVDATGATV